MSAGIGGYFELELRPGAGYHKQALPLNTGRNALEYILKARGFRKLYIPFYTCHVLLEPILKCGIGLDYYHIDEQLEPVFDFATMEEEAAFLYTNYYGLKDAYIAGIRSSVKHLIVDNAQAFFAPPLPETDTFYSARKFFGVPDGAYVYTSTEPVEITETDQSWSRCGHLLIRADVGAEHGYPAFRDNDAALDHNPVRRMSRLTQSILASIDYEDQAARRKYNYDYLDEALEGVNGLRLTRPEAAVPMVYPFLSAASGLRAHLISRRIFVATYWPEVSSTVPAGSTENRLVHQLIPLPVDQRLTLSDLNFIIKTVKECISKANS